jgi:hypothetical protein
MEDREIRKEGCKAEGVRANMRLADEGLPALLFFNYLKGTRKSLYQNLGEN